MTSHIGLWISGFCTGLLMSGVLAQSRPICHKNTNYPTEPRRALEALPDD